VTRDDDDPFSKDPDVRRWQVRQRLAELEAMGLIRRAGTDKLGQRVSSQRDGAMSMARASAILALPSVVLGPVDSPPWNRQRRFPGITGMMHGAPALVLAQHLGRNLRFKGSPLCDRPRSNISRQQCRS
jgi:hypothetical protein